jgi:ankyrin repeat protein
MAIDFTEQSTLSLLARWLPALLLVLVTAGCRGAPPTPLAAAAAADDVERVRALVTETQPNTLELQIALAWAAREGGSHAARVLLDAGAPIDGDDGRPAFGWTPLITAVHTGHWQTARDLLAWGADPNAATPDGLTPLIMITDESDDDWHVRMVEDLLLAGADPRRTTSNGATALTNALGGGNPRIVARLLAAAPDLKLPDGFAGSVAGMVAGLRGDGDLLDRVRLAPPADDDGHATAPNGRTALMVAAGRGDLAVVRALLEAGADPRAENAEHLTALTHAVAGGNADVVRTVLDAAPGLRLHPIPEDEGALFAARLQHRDELLALLAERNALP